MIDWVDRIWVEESVQVSKKLRRASTAFVHWCSGCEELHQLPDGWSFNGDVNSPTFAPSFKHTMERGKVCHYILINGVLNYCGDSTHALAGQNIPLPDLPSIYQDEMFKDGEQHGNH